MPNRSPKLFRPAEVEVLACGRPRWSSVESRPRELIVEERPRKMLALVGDDCPDRALGAKNVGFAEDCDP